MEEQKNIQEIASQPYVPSALERKKALVMYFFFGILMTFFKKKISVYEFFHLKQAIGRRTLFFLCLVVSVFLVFIPYIRILPFFVFIGFLIFFYLFARQAHRGLYDWSAQSSGFHRLFGGVGSWILQIFDFGFDVDSDGTVTMQDEKTKSQQ